jgi:uncharacterized membrane protein YqaE (UPF0057 family)
MNLPIFTPFPILGSLKSHFGLMRTTELRLVLLAVVVTCVSVNAAVAQLDAEGNSTKLNIILTLLGGLPGMVHALWLVATDKK